MTAAEELKYFVPGMLFQYLINTIVIYALIGIMTSFSEGLDVRLHAATLELVETTADVIEVGYYHFSGH